MRALAAAVFSVVACVSQAMEVAVKTEASSSPRPVIHGSTNLPDGTKLAVIVSRQESAFRAEILTEVKSGSFTAGPLSQRTNDLNPGVYNLEVLLAAIGDQPLAVRDAVGKEGEKLQGPFVKRDGRSRTLRYMTTFQVGLGANADLDRSARERAKMSQTKWWKNQCKEICTNADWFERGKSKAFNSDECLKTCISTPPIVAR